MKKFFSILLVSITTVAGHAQTPTLDWGYGFGGVGDDEAHTVAIDSAGNHYICGNFWGIVDFDPSEQGVHELSSFGSWDIFIVKLDTAGEFLNAWQIGGPSPDGVTNPPPPFANQGTSVKSQMDIDADGNIYLACYVGAECDVDPGSGTTLIGSVQDNLALLKLDSNADLIWYRVFNEQPFQWGFRDACLDADANWYLLGLYSGQVDIDPGPLDTFILSPDITVNGGSRYILKLNTNGEFQWAGSLPARPSPSQTWWTIPDFGRPTLGVFPNGDVAVSVFFHGLQEFRLPSDTFEIEASTAVGASDIFVTRISSEGSLVWNAQIKGGDSIASGLTSSLDVSRSGDVYVAGTMFNGAIDFDPGDDSFILDESGGYIFKLGPDGSFRWALGQGYSNSSRYRAVAVDINQNPWVVGYFRDSLTVPIGNDSIVIENQDDWSSVVLQIDSGGNYLWATGLDLGLITSNVQYSAHWDIDAHPNGGVLASGTFKKDTIDVGFGQVPYQIPSQGAADVYLLRLVDDNVVGISEYEAMSQGVLVFPNPAVGSVSVRLPAGCLSSDYRMYSATGERISEGSVANNGLISFPTTIANGIYILQLNSCDQNHTVKLLVQ